MSSNSLVRQTSLRLKPDKSPLILEPMGPESINKMDRASGDTQSSDADLTQNNKFVSLNIHDEITDNSEKCVLLLDGYEQLRVKSAEEFLKRLLIPDNMKKVKVVSIFGNTGEGKSHTLNQTFFNGRNIFRTSPEQTSCTLGVWAAYDSEMKVICLDTEGLLGITSKENQRTRLLLKVLAVSDIVIYRTRAERLQRDLFTFLGNASRAYTHHFHSALQSVWHRADFDGPLSALGPTVIIFHETRHTNTLQHNLSESPEDILRGRFAELGLETNAFSALKYIGIQTAVLPTSFIELKNAMQVELENSTVRSARNPQVVFHALKALNDKFSSEIVSTPFSYLDHYFTCPLKCQSCEVGCQLSMGHLQEKEPHNNSNKCKYQHQYENCIYLCKNCHKNGKRQVVTSRVQTTSENSWSSLLRYAWSGYVIECPTCGEIYRSRQHWFGNKNPEDVAVRTEFAHVWPGERNLTIGSQNSAQKVVDTVSLLTDAVTSVSSQPAKALTSWVADQIAPKYWRPNHEITECFKCKKSFSQTATKHHCRSCGEGFCAECSSKKQPVPARGWYDDVRVCDKCYVENNPSLSNSVNDAEVRVRKYGEAVVSTISSVASVLEYPRGLIKETARPAYWTPDIECDTCFCCEMPFGTLVQLHHCRDCGRGVCDDCSPTRKPVPMRGWDNPVRVCNACVKKD